MNVYDARCNDCGFEFEEHRQAAHPVLPCPECRSKNTVTIWKSYPQYTRVKDPYDLLDGPIPSSKPIKSFAKDKRRGGKDTV